MRVIERRKMNIFHFQYLEDIEVCIKNDAKETRMKAFEEALIYDSGFGPRKKV